MWSFFLELSESALIVQEIILATMIQKVRHCTKLSQPHSILLLSQIRKLKFREFSYYLKIL